MKAPDKAQLLEILEAKDELGLVIRGHLLIEEALNVVISESLPEPHRVEIEKLSFSLKIDLALALRTIRPDSRPAFRAINRLRNRFAHRPTAALAGADALDLRNLLSPWQRNALGDQLREQESPRSMLERVMAVTFIEARGVVLRLQDQKIADEVMHEIVVETLAHSEKQSDSEIHRQALDAELRDRIEKRRRERMAAADEAEA